MSGAGKDSTPVPACRDERLEGAYHRGRQAALEACAKFAMEEATICFRQNEDEAAKRFRSASALFSVQAKHAGVDAGKADFAGPVAQDPE